MPSKRAIPTLWKKVQVKHPNIPLAYSNFNKLLPTFKKEVLKSSDFLNTSEKVVVYTDGCCLNSNISKDNLNLNVFRSGAASAYWGKVDHPLNTTLGLNTDIFTPTNNRAELCAFHLAVMLANAFNIDFLTVKTDSKLVINCCTNYLPNWKIDGWKGSSGKKIINADIWKKIYKDLEKVHVTFEYASDKTDGIQEAHKLAHCGLQLNSEK